MEHIETTKTQFLTLKKYKQDEKKTYDIDVLDKNGDNLLGLIQWYGPWQKYTLVTLHGRVFDAKCLTEITEYIKKLMSERKKQ